MADQVTILAVDDSPDILFAISAICDLEEWKTVTTTYGEEVCALIREHRPNLILVDYHMPSVNGLEVVKNIRRIDSDTPILVLTVEESREIANRFLAAGANDFALKPIKPVDLISRIRVHLNAGNVAAFPKQEEYVKGINNQTLTIVESFLKYQDTFLTIEDISKQCGLAYQTTYRYLTHMVAQGTAEVRSEYGKQGRPKQKYRYKRH
ncbi:MAG TPA: response regulator [Clostridiales bacterium]|nr:response regulator [Clostridiales bacterium]